MRYELDSNGYVIALMWGCNTGKCAEYTGAVPTGYSSLKEWADNACINAYYIDSNGNLTLDPAREKDLIAAAEQQARENSPVTHKELEEAIGNMSGGSGSAASSYDEETGDLTIYGNSVVYDEETGNLTI